MANSHNPWSIEQHVNCGGGPEVCTTCAEPIGAVHWYVVGGEWLCDSCGEARVAACTLEALGD